MTIDLRTASFTGSTTGMMDVQWRRRLEQLVDGPSEPAEIKRRIDRIETLRLQDATAAALEFQLLAAAVHGDPLQFPKEGYDVLQDYGKRSGFTLADGGPDISHPMHKDNTPSLPKGASKPNFRWQPPKTPLLLLRRLQEVLHGREISNDQILAYCEAPLVEWADSHRSEVEEILTFIARANRFGDRAGLLSGLGKALESAGNAELAARALAVAFAGHRGGGGWLSFGDKEHEDLLVRAFKASRPVALAVLAQEMVHRNGDWGVTQHVIGFLGRHDDVTLATAMWDEARESMLVRLPGHETSQGPFLPFEPTKVPTWTHEDAALFLILARISHPERHRKTAALCAVAWLVQREPMKCVPAFREILKSSLCFTHQLWLLQLLGQFEPEPFVISQALAVELNVFVGSGRCGTEQLALMLLKRANIAVTVQVVRSKPLVSVTLSPNKQERCLSLDVHKVVPKVADWWPHFPEIVAARFQTIFESDESHEARMKDRWEASFSVARKSYIPASLHPWEAELFAESLNVVLTGLEAHLWSKGEWDHSVWPKVLSWLLPNAETPARHYWSRRVRPSWPLPSTLVAGVQAVQTVPDGELAGWKRVGYFETYLETDSKIDEIKLSTRARTGVVLGEKLEPLPQAVLPLGFANDKDWLSKARPLFSLDGFSGAIAGHSVFGIPFEFREVLGLVRNLAGTLNLSGRREIGPLDLFDADGKRAVAFRWWGCRPLGDHGFADETPRLLGGALLMRPDLLDQIVAATKLQVFEAVSLNVETMEQLIAKHQTG
ncbi:MAG: hypothetical protein WDM80_12560 [Limisphaerales bacterium]